jgi:hypothetical protein
VRSGFVIAVGDKRQMRILSSARIVILIACPETRASICSSLAALGMLRVLPAATPDEAQGLAREGAPDLCIVDPRGLARGDVALPKNPFDPARTPGILIAADPSSELLRAASAAGYGLVISLPVAPRHLYRRIGSVLQRVRRAARRNAAKVAPAAAVARCQEG